MLKSHEYQLLFKTASYITEINDKTQQSLKSRITSSLFIEHSNMTCKWNYYNTCSLFFLSFSFQFNFFCQNSTGFFL